MTTTTPAAVERQFRKRPVVIEAVRFDGIENVDDGREPMFDGSFIAPDWLLVALAGAEGHPGSAWTACATPESKTLDCLAIGTLEGNHIAMPGDWIIRGVKGELYPCKPDIFAATYEPAALTPPAAPEIPAGMKLVPVDLTELHLLAAHDAMVRFKPDTVRGKPVFEALQEVWSALLAYTPTARPATAGEVERARQMLDERGIGPDTLHGPYVGHEDVVLTVAAALASDRGEPGTGWVYDNEDTGEEYSPNHPIESGETPDATNVRRSTAQEDHLWSEMQRLNERGASDRGEIERLNEAVRPWADFHGELPDYDHPLRCVYESGIQYAVELLAKELKVDDWTPCEGTEEFDGDLGGTLMNIVLAAMPKDQDGDPMWPQDVRDARAVSRGGDANA
ncbi:hypothetical protein [Sphingomonas sp.]|uniref:hypothetical protein n=1 Tax=Sphingomonas sp. TaxID=28214 RepID=UPI00257C5D09|nr:hypothetical protein [Sphingomonas sp.]